MQIVPDVMLGVVEVLKLLTDAGDAVVVNSPVYPPFFEFVSTSAVAWSRPRSDALGRIDLGVVGAGACAEATRGGGRAAYLICNPQNPTGAVHTAEELTAVLELATALRRAGRRRRDPRPGGPRRGDLHPGGLAAGGSRRCR